MKWAGETWRKRLAGTFAEAVENEWRARRAADVVQPALDATRDALASGRLGWTVGRLHWRSVLWSWPWQEWSAIPEADRPAAILRLGRSATAADRYLWDRTGGSMLWRTCGGSRVFRQPQRLLFDTPAMRRRAARQAAAMRPVFGNPASFVLCYDLPDGSVRGWRLPDSGDDTSQAAAALRRDAQGRKLRWLAWWLAVGPLTVDERGGGAYWPLSSWVRSGIVRDGDDLLASKTHWTASDEAPPVRHAETFWRTVAEWLGRGSAAWDSITTTTPAPGQESPPPEPDLVTTTTTTTAEPSGPVTTTTTLAVSGSAKAARPYVLLEGPTRIDAKAAALADDLQSLQLPRSMARIKTWESHQQDYAAELLHEYEEGPERDRLLEVQRKRDGGGAYKLTAAGLEELKRRLIGRAYILTDERGRPERLVKAVQLPRGGGVLTCWLSFYGRADLLLSSVRDSHIANGEQLIRKLKDDEKGRFPAMRDGFDHSKTIESLESEVRFLRQTNDAWRLLPKLLAELGRQRELPLAIPDWELRHVLGAEAAVDGHFRVEKALEVLRRLETGYGLGRVTGQGGVVSWTEYEAAGPGRHGEGTWRVWLTERAVGCLEVWRTLRTQLPATGDRPKLHEDRFDWGQGPEANNGKKAKPTGLSYRRSDTSLLPHYAREADLDEAQRKLVLWLPAQITLNRDTPRPGRRRASGVRSEEPRLYDRDFCPRLPDGRKFHAALGHDRKRAAERGWRLVQSATTRTKSGGGRPSGLLQLMGYEYPPGAAEGRREQAVRDCLAAIRGLVEDKLGGAVVAEDATGGWLSADEAAALPATTQATKLLWLLFLPEDWRRRVHETIEANSAARGRPIRVTTDPAEKRAAEAYRSKASRDADRDNPLALWNRLKTARKARGATQSDLAALFGVSRVMFTQWETAKKPVRPGLVPLLEKWIEDGTEPTAEQLSEAR